MKMIAPCSRIAAAALFLFAACGPVSAEQQRADLQVADVLARPGEPVELTAKLERAGPVGVNIAGARIDFRIDGKAIGSAKTDERGVARLTATAASGRGDLRVKVLYEGDAKYQRAEHFGLLAVRLATDPVLVVDPDWTLALTDNLNTALGGSDCPPMANAQEVMQRLSQSYTIVYVTSRARQLRKRTVSWLERYGFPRGPSYYLNPRDYPTYDAVAFKRTIVADIVKRFPLARVGIGSGLDHLEAYRSPGLETVLIGKKPVPGAIVAGSWDAVEQAVTQAEAAAATRRR